MLRDAWTIAIEALREIELKGSSARLALSRAGKQERTQNSNVIGLAHKLVFEVVRRQNFLDHMINLALDGYSISDLHGRLRAFLRLFAYEVKIRGDGSYERAANAARIARSILGWRMIMDVEEALSRLLSLQPKKILKRLPDTKKIALEFFQPEWFVKYCFKLFGRHEALGFFESTISATSTYIRINMLKIADVQELIAKLASEDVILQKVEGLFSTYKVVETKKPLVRTLSFKEGEFYIQDKASCLAVEIASPKSNMTVLDICAAPGTKTTHLAQLMKNQGIIYSLDYSRRRMRVWQSEMQRRKVKIVTPLIGDAYKPLPLTKVKADIVLLDPPCTSTGALSRIPSAKWRLTSRSIKHMAAIQWRMLINCAKYVKKGGSLIYSTCSVTVEENELLIEKFLKWNPEFKSVETQPLIGLSGLRGQTASQRLYPHIHDCNGFFITKLENQD